MAYDFTKYRYYEKSVMSPDVDVEWYTTIYRELRAKEPTRLREDFCGTFAVSAEWVRQSSKHQAIALDLDPEPLSYGREHHYRKLKPNQKRRLKILQQDVLVAPKDAADLVCAANFSFYFFKERETLERYFRSCLRGLVRDGILILEMVGGPGMQKPVKESTPFYLSSGKSRRHHFTYVWHQKDFDPITHHVHYAIHFRFRDGSELLDAFTYQWRLWSIPEVRELLIQAGFKDVVVYWDQKGNGLSGIGYERIEKAGPKARPQARPHDSWICYVVGVK